jgi:Ni2+-binding GTPase involved in maturation of urease and hydrogenase
MKTETLRIVVGGPPGSGKTEVLANIVKQLTAQFPGLTVQGGTEFLKRLDGPVSELTKSETARVMKLVHHDSYEESDERLGG